MSLKVAVRKVGNSKMVKMSHGRTADWMTPAYARKLAERLVKAANTAEIVVFKSAPFRPIMKDRYFLRGV